MSLYAELNAKKTVPGLWNGLIEQIQNNNPAFLEDGNVAIAVTTVASYLDQVALFYTLNENAVYNILSEDDVNNLKSMHSTSLQSLTALKNAINNLQGKGYKNQVKKLDDIIKQLGKDTPVIEKLAYDDNLSLPESVYKLEKEIKANQYTQQDFKWPGFFEYSRIYRYNNSNLTHDEVLEMFISKTPAQVKAEYEKAVVTIPKFYEYRFNKDLITPEIRDTGDPEVIRTFMQNHADVLTDVDNKYLNTHLEAIAKQENIARLNSEAEQRHEDFVRPVPVNVTANSCSINVHQPAYQTSFNGCWSCAAQMMIQSRGIQNVTQEDIRAYRPKLGHEEVIPAEDEMDTAYNSDNAKNLLEMGDSILAYAPNTMLNEIAIGIYNHGMEDRGISKETYTQNIVKQMKKTIRHAIADDHSPLAILIPGHYLTIVGLDGDTVKFKDSQKHKTNNNPDTTYIMNIRDFVDQYFLNVEENQRQQAIQLTWVSQVELSKDGKTIYGVPSEYVHMKDDGTIQLPPDNIQELTNNQMVFPHTREGYPISRSAGNEQANVAHNYDPMAYAGVEITEKVYLPKKLNMAYHQDRMRRRSNEKEAALISSDKTYFGLDYPRKNVPVDNPVQIAQEENKAPENKAPENKNEAPKHRTWLYDLKENTKVLSTRFSEASTLSFNRKNAFGELKSNVDALSRNAESVWNTVVRTGGIIPKEDKDRLVEMFNKTFRNCRAYLNEKYKEMMADSSRKYNSKKQGLEQSRIKVVIDTYEYLSGMAAEMMNETAEQKKDRQDIIDNYKKTLISHVNDKKELQDATFRNRMGIPAGAEQKLDKIQEQFSKKPGDQMPAIGSANPKDRLSDKDFAALCYAAAATRDVFNQSRNLYTDVENEERFHILGSKLCEFLASDQQEDGKQYANGIQLSKKAAIQALNQYKNGNKAPLADLIREGITNLASFARNNTVENRASYLYFSEMGQRLSAMLERDPALMKLAVQGGMKHSDTAFLRAIGEEGYYAEKAGQIQKEMAEIIAKKQPEWDAETREEKYSTLMLNEALHESHLRKGLISKEEAGKTMAQELIQKHKIEKRFHQSVDKLYSNNPDYKAIMNKRKTAVSEALRENTAEQKEEKMKAAEDAFLKEVTEYHEKRLAVNKSYAEKLTNTYQDKLNEIDKLYAALKKPKLSAARRLEAAEKMALTKLNERRYVLNLSAAEQAVINEEKKELTEYLKTKKENTFTMLESERKDMIKRNGLKQLINREAGLQKNELIESLAKPGTVQSEKAKIKNYLKEKGYMDYSPEDFRAKVLTKGAESDRKHTVEEEISALKAQSQMRPLGKKAGKTKTTKTSSEEKKKKGLENTP